MVTEIGIVESAKHEGYCPVSRKEFEEYTLKRIEFYQDRLRKIESLNDRQPNNGMTEALDEIHLTNIKEDVKKRLVSAKLDLFSSQLCEDDEIAFSRDLYNNPFIYMIGRASVENIRKWESEINVAYQ